MLTPLFAIEEGFPNIIHLGKVSLVDAAARIIAEKEQLLLKPTKKATIINFDIEGEEPIRRFNEWWRSQQGTWLHPLRWQIRNANPPKNKPFEFKISSWACFDALQPNHTWALAAIPSIDECKSLLDHALSIRSNHKFIKVCVRHGAEIRPRQIIDVLNNTCDRFRKYDLLWTSHYFSNEDTEWTLVVRNINHVDLHGDDRQIAQLKTESVLSMAESFGKQNVRVITGRGKHVNAKTGQRGVLARSLPKWIKDLPQIAKKAKRDKSGGMYHVELRQTVSVTIRAGTALPDAIALIALYLLMHGRVRLNMLPEVRAQIAPHILGALTILMRLLGSPIRSYDLCAEILLSLTRDKLPMFYPV